MPEKSQMTAKFPVNKDMVITLFQNEANQEASSSDVWVPHLVGYLVFDNTEEDRPFVLNTGTNREPSPKKISSKARPSSKPHREGVGIVRAIKSEPDATTPWEPNDENKAEDNFDNYSDDRLSIDEDVFSSAALKTEEHSILSSTATKNKSDLSATTSALKNVISGGNLQKNAKKTGGNRSVEMPERNDEYWLNRLLADGISNHPDIIDISDTDVAGETEEHQLMKQFSVEETTGEGDKAEKAKPRLTVDNVKPGRKPFKVGDRLTKKEILKRKKDKESQEEKEKKRQKLEEKQSVLIINAETDDVMTVEHSYSNKIEDDSATEKDENPSLKFCKICGKAYAKANFLRIHMQKHGECKNMCIFCDQVFDNFGKLVMHLSTHDKDEPYECPICSKKFKTPKQLRSHSKIHSDQKNYQCPTCGRRFRQKPHLNFHQASVHKVGLSTCNICQKSFRRLAELKLHKLAHAGKKPFKCKQCPGKLFTSEERLNLHVNNHDRLLPFPCSLCGQRFQNKSTQETHLEYHRGSKLFPCGICSKEYKSVFLLKQHIKGHEKVKKRRRGVPAGRIYDPKQCKLCHKTMANERGMKVHMTLHFRDRLPFQCEFCEKRFAQEINMLDHRTEHLDLPAIHGCQFCGVKFKSRLKLKRHRYNKHPVGRVEVIETTDINSVNLQGTDDCVRDQPTRNVIWI